jgi:putative ABC transport system permease protein
MLVDEVARAARSLRRSPGLCLVVVLTLGLGIGAATAMFSLVDAVLLKPLPFATPGRLVTLWTTHDQEGPARFRVSAWEYAHWQERRDLFDGLVLTKSMTAPLVGDGDAVELAGSRVSDGFFPLLRIPARLGRVLAPEDFEASAAPVVVLSDALWRGRFGADPQVLGRSIVLGQQIYVVVGVLPRQLVPGSARASGSFELVRDEERFWVPLKDVQPGNHSHVFGVLGRLRSDIDPGHAGDRLDNAAFRSQAAAEGHVGEGVSVATLQDEAAGAVRATLWSLLAAVGCLLAIACVNVAHLLLLRASARARELAVRAAIGAGRLALLRMFLAETLILGLAGGAAGALVAAAAIRGIVAWNPVDVPRLAEAGLDLRALAMTLAVCVSAGLVVSLAPALQSSGRDPAGLLRGSGATAGTERATSRFRRALAASEMGLAVVLVVGGALLAKSFASLEAVDPGFDSERVLVFGLTHPAARYGERSQIVGFYERLFGELAALPGVQRVSASYDPPLESNWYQSLELPDVPAPPGADRGALFRTVTPGYFGTLGVELLEGRPFTDADDVGAPGAAIVNEAFVRRFFPDGRALGRRLLTSTTQWLWGEVVPREFHVVGVVENESFDAPGTAAQPAYYLPLRQTPQERMTVLVRAAVDPESLVAPVRDRLRALDPALPMAEVRTLGSMRVRTLARPRFRALVLAIFAGFALLLATIGLSGVLSDAVLQRRREIGVRLALGADRRSVFLFMLSEGLGPALNGLLLGLAGSLTLGRALGGLLFGVSPLDPQVYAVVAAVLIAVGTLACSAPAWRAARTDPMAALRSD